MQKSITQISLKRLDENKRVLDIFALPHDKKWYKNQKCPQMKTVGLLCLRPRYQNVFFIPVP
jgi:hypothetical protein